MGILSELLLGLRNAEQVCDQLCTAHVVEDLLTDLQVLLAVNVIHGHAAVQSHVPGVLEYGKLICRDHTGIPGSFGKQLIPLLDIAAHDQSAAVFAQLVETVCHFLPIGLDGEIGLSQRDDLFARITVLHDQIAGVAGQLVVNKFLHTAVRHRRCFPDLRKTFGNVMPTVFTGDHSALDDLGKVFPFCIIQDRSQFSGIPILGTVRVRSANVLKAFIFGGNEMAHVVSLPYFYTAIVT